MTARFCYGHALWLLLLLVGTPGAAAAADTAALPDSLGLSGLIERALPEALRLQATRAALDGGRAARELARVQRLPGLGLDASAGWVSQVQEISLPGKTIQFGDGSSADLALGTSWTLYAGGTLKAGEAAAEAELQARGHDLASDSLGLLGELRGVYIQGLTARVSVLTAQNSLSRLERHLEDVRGARRAGLAGAEEELAVAGRVQQARQELLQRQGELEQLAFELGRLCGTPEHPIHPAGSLDASLLESRAIPESLPSERALAARQQGAEARVRQATGAARPRVEARAGWHLGRPGVDPIRNDWMTYGTAGLSLHWPLLDHGRVRQQAAINRADALRLQRSREELARQTSARRIQANTLLESAQQVHEAAAARTRIETERLALVEQRWTQGLSSQQTWLDASDDLVLAQQQQALAAARVRLAEVRLLAARGQ
ncbi:MAG: TolC family protein [Calditrichaeota bacterium]|nr:TolC family protein [Calditrichota bacterium]